MVDPNLDIQHSRLLQGYELETRMYWDVSGAPQLIAGPIPKWEGGYIAAPTAGELAEALPDTSCIIIKSDRGIEVIKDGIKHTADNLVTALAKVLIGEKDG